MSEREPSPDLLGAVNELRGEVGEVRIGLGDVRGRLERLDGTVAEQGERLDRLGDEVSRQGERLDRVDVHLEGLTGEVVEQGRRLDGLTGEVATMKRDLPAQIVAGVLMGFERSAYVSDLRTLQREMDQVKADVAELKRASGK
ncbi:MAG: hypothetical protein OXP69_05335 [Spirochaetaceae bacterium]|nr:hypothetical protein [Spirochaetaceae bacterium]